MLYPTEKFNLEVPTETNSQINQVFKALQDAGIQHSGVMLDILMQDVDILAEAIKQKNERFAALAIDRLISFHGFDGTPVEKWNEFGESIHRLVTAKEMKEPEFLDNILALDYAVKVTQHPYRTAMVYDTVLLIERTSEQGNKLEDELAKKADAKRDNHTAYTVEMRDGKKAYIMCSDFKIRIGLSIEMRNW